LESNSNLIVPTGTILPFAGTNVPSGWMLCDGRSLSRSTYAQLFQSIGASYGSSDGNSFNLPDLRGRFIRGTDNSPDGFAVDPDRDSRITLYPGGKTGRELGSYQMDEFKSHTHEIHHIQFDMGVWSAIANSGAHDATGDAGEYAGRTRPYGGYETRPKNVYVNFIIKY